MIIQINSYNRYQQMLVPTSNQIQRRLQQRRRGGRRQATAVWGRGHSIDFGILRLQGMLPGHPDNDEKLARFRRMVKGKPRTHEQFRL